MVDTAPLLERDFARRAGLGWFGKNTLLLNKRLGSYFFLAALLVDAELWPDAPFEARHCGTCTACLDACPTEAFVGPGVLDSRRCISYLTIELKGASRRSCGAASATGCSAAIFARRYVRGTARRRLRRNRRCGRGRTWKRWTRSNFWDCPRSNSDVASAARPLMRSKRRGLLRNAALVLGNVGDERALPALRRALEDAEPLVREAAGWAIAEIEEKLKN